MYPYPAPPLVTVGIATIAAIVACLFVWANHAAAKRAGDDPSSVRRRTVVAAALVLGWGALFGGAALNGLLARFEARPPPLGLAMVLLLAAAFTLGLSRWALPLTRLPLAWLIGFQAFRLPLELVMHEAATNGVMPSYLSFSGYNFDIATGALAIPVAWLASRGGAPRWLLYAWNVLGLSCLTAIVIIAIGTAPFILAFGPEQNNRWVAYVPFIFLPAILVVLAVLGHVLVLRQLGNTRPPP